MVKNSKFVILVFFLLAAGLSSCSIKENRSVCPTYLLVKSSEPLAPGTRAVVSVFHAEDGLVESSIVPGERLYPDGYEVKARRGELTARVVCGIRDMDIFSSIVRNAALSQSDSLYRFEGTVVSNEETCEIVREPVKEFTTLTLRINNASVPFLLRLSGVWDRENALDFRPGRGNLAFGINDEFMIEGTHGCRLSRQGDASLSLEVYRQEDTENPWRVFPLGDMMEKAGYHRDASPMEDVTVFVDLTEGVISIGIGGWDVVTDFNVYDF